MILKPTMSCFVVLLFLLVIATVTIRFCTASSYAGCIESERRALLRFKQDLNDPSNRLASWTADGDCCEWVGVGCHTLTGHVLEIRLRNPYDLNSNNFSEYIAYRRSKLGGKINPSLLDLNNLIYLDLSSNDFERIQIPTFLGSMKNLRYLNLSHSGFFGMIPHQLGNLSNLQHLDLCQNMRNHQKSKLYVESFRWLSDLHLLKHLDLGGADLSKTFDQLLIVANALPSLAVLKLSDCQLHHLTSIITNFSSLTELDLSSNRFDNPLVPSWIFSLSHLVSLHLGDNNFQGPIPSGIQNLTSLRYLDLSNNVFNLSTPNWLYKLSCLEYLFLSSNKLQGKLLDVLGNLTSITNIDLSSNRLEGKVPTSVSKCCNLKSITLRDVMLSQDIAEVLNILSGCISNSLQVLLLSDNQLHGHLTNEVRLFKKLTALHIGNNSISGHIPPSLGELSSLMIIILFDNQLNGSLSQIHFANLTSLELFDVGGNSITFEVSPYWIPPFQLDVLFMASCTLGPQFPSWLLSQKFLLALDISNSGIVDVIPNKFWKSNFQLIFLNLSRNQIYGEIPKLTELDALNHLDLSSNNLSGPLPSLSSNVYALYLSNNLFLGTISHFLCHRINESKRMQILDLGENLLYGELLDCFMNWKELRVINLSKNKFSGTLPSSMGNLGFLRSLNLCGNNLSGTLISIENCTKLVSLDIGENEFVGNVPSWIGERFFEMVILNLHSNNFDGSLPMDLCHLKHLQILDLSYNNLSRSIPRCISKLRSMVTTNYAKDNSILYAYVTDIFSRSAMEEASLVMKGKTFEYNTILNLVRHIDLSRNNFSGEIPREITNLGTLISLNLSHNSFIGRIPMSINVMTKLESLDLSENQLSGEIPQSISALTFLSYLNLSNNHLTGKIPTGTQLQSFNASCFAGNELCGSPLPDNCIVLEPDDENEGNDDSDGDDKVDLFYVSMALGFMVGFWSVISPLLVNKTWRHMYSRFLDRVGDKFVSVVRKCG